MPASIFVTTAPGAEKAKPDATLFNSEGVDLVGDQVVQHGNLAEGFTGVNITGPDGAVTHADVYAWPQDLLTIAGSHAVDGAGGIWVATPLQEGDVTLIRRRRRLRRRRPWATSCTHARTTAATW